MENRHMQTQTPIFDQTICGIKIDAFAQKPTPEEIGMLVAHWNSEDQASFFLHLGEKLHDCCNFRDEIQCSQIGRDIGVLETMLLDGSASRVIRMIADSLVAEDA
jgi:hypothetical protein